jgi:fusicocca-2,10(14)-diene synthase
MGITIPDDEMEICKTVGKPTWEALVLTNDLYSWKKERDDAAGAGQPEVVNAVWVIMREHSVAEPEAKEICKVKIKESVAKVIQVADKAKSDTTLSRDLVTYTEAMLYSISGNLVWSIYCPRYHPEETLGEVDVAIKSKARLAPRTPRARAGLL